MKFLDDLKKEIDELSVENLIKPSKEVGPNDHIVGEADDDLKKLYGLAMKVRKTAEKKMVTLQYSTDEKIFKRLIETTTELVEKHNLLMNLFWFSVNDRFSLWAKPSAGIRTGWKVVWSDCDDCGTSKVINLGVDKFYVT